VEDEEGFYRYTGSLRTHWSTDERGPRSRQLSCMHGRRVVVIS
jgi:hypothetical protein